MKSKIDAQYNDVIYEEYEKLLAVGVPITRIADLVNEKMGTDFAESSLRGRYKDEKNKREGADIQDDEEYQKRLLRLAEADIKLMFNRKVIQKERSVVNGLLRESADKSVVTEAIVNLWGEEPLHKNSAKVDFNQRTDLHEYKYGYSFGDVHYGYKSDLAKNPYNPEIAAHRVRWMFDRIIWDVQEYGYKEIFLVDHGDSIEGSALRVSQLLNIAEDMTKQASSYTDLFIEGIKTLSKSLPNVLINVMMISSDNHSELRLYNTKRGDLPENLQSMIAHDVNRSISDIQEFGGLNNITFTYADEIYATFGGEENAIVFAHGHQYSRRENILEQVEHKHGKPVMAYIGGHWHSFSVKYKNVKNGVQQALIFLPPVVGDTDYSDSLFVSSLPGFCKIKIDTVWHHVSAEFISL